MKRKNRNRMEIKVVYDGGRTGVITIKSPTGGNNRLLWRIGTKFLLFGGWLMFGRRKEWINETRSL